MDIINVRTSLRVLLEGPRSQDERPLSSIRMDIAMPSTLYGKVSLPETGVGMGNIGVH